jgi:hypothetical protein
MRMGRHGTVCALVMEGPKRQKERGKAIEWIIRLSLLGLALAAAWTVFGDDIAQLFNK